MRDRSPSPPGFEHLKGPVPAGTRFASLRLLCGLPHAKDCKDALEVQLQETPGATRTAMGSLTNGSGSALAYSIQTNTSANGFEIVLPTGTNVTGKTFPSRFSSANCTDNANVLKCTNGAVQVTRP